MPIVMLEFTAALEKIIDLRPADDFETQGSLLFLEMICEGCKDTSTKKRNDFNLRLRSKYTVNYNNKRLEVHAYTKCVDCGIFGIIQMRPEMGPYSPLTVDLSRAGKYTPFMHFIFEGININYYNVIGNFVATTEDNRKITVPFNSGGDYVETGGTGVAVRNMKLGFKIIDSTSQY